MTKSFVLLLLLCCSALCGFSQRPDSVQINGEWRYIYPEQQPRTFTTSYYSNFDLSREFFDQWLKWKMAGDSRADLKLHDLQDSIQMELYRTLEDNDSIFYGSRKRRRHHDYRYSSYSHYYSYTSKVPKRIYYANINVHYTPDLHAATGIPPVVRSLPDGKYVQYYQPWATFEKREDAEVVQGVVASFFELKNDNLNGPFIHFDMDGDTLGIGTFNDGFQDGEWLVVNNKHYEYDKQLSGKKAERLYIYNTYSVTNYSNGLRNGVEKEYANGRIFYIKNYENERQVGQTTVLGGSDSTVYDPVQVFHPVIARSSFPDYEASGRYLQYHHSYDKQKDLNFLELERMGYLVSERSTIIPSNIRYKSISDSLFCDSIRKDRSDLYYSSYPIFETYYKVYERKTNRLIFERYIDTTNWTFYGNAYYKNGAIMDSVYDDLSDYGHVNFKVFKENGELIFSDQTKSVEPLKTYQIDGFTACDLEINGTNGYELVRSLQRGDTIFQDARWDKKKQLLQKSYNIDSTEYFWTKLGEDSYYLLTVSRDSINWEFGSGGVRIIDHEDVATAKHTVSIIENGKPFSGEIEFEHQRLCGLEFDDNEFEIGISRKESRKAKLKPGYLETEMIHNVMEDILERLALLEEGYQLASLEGNVKDHVLEGEVEVSQKHFEGKEQELSYSNGLPSGEVNVYTTKAEVRDRFAIHQEIKAHNEALGKKHFHKSMNRRYLFKTYTLSNGKYNGPIVLFNPAGDTIGYIPYVNGQKQGKAFHFTESNLIQLEYANDKFVNDLILKSAEWDGVYDTLMSFRFDQNGQVIQGHSRIERYNSEDYSLHEITVDLTEPQPKNFQFEIRDNGELEFSGKTSGQWLKTGTVYHGVIPSYTKEFNDFFVEVRVPLLEIVNELEVGYEGLVLDGSILYSDYELQYYYRPSNRTVSRYDGYDEPDYLYPMESNEGYFKKYYPNEQIAREGKYNQLDVYRGLFKAGLWKTYTYNGLKLHEIIYKDSIVVINGIKFPIRGTQVEFDTLGNVISNRLLLEELETYECSSDDYYAERQFICLSSTVPTKMNGWTKNYYDNGTLMNEGMMINGMPDGLWKFYTPDGKLSRLGRYIMGKQNGKWLKGDLSEKAYIGDVCMDPDDPNYAYHLHQLETDKEIEVVVYKMGEPLNNNHYGDSRGRRGMRDDIQLR